MKKVIIAIDGPSASGKSTIARQIAKALGYAYVDSGAMYRAVALYLLENNIPVADMKAVEAALSDIDIRFQRTEQGNRTLLNNRDVESEIRRMEVSEIVSQVAAIPAVRHEMVRQQQAMGKHKGLVMDGRDISTVVFPNAEVKLFVTADVETRARRRHQELLQRGQNVPLKEVLDNLRERDRIDSTRAVGPLRKAEDAVEINNTSLSLEEQFRLAMEVVAARTGG